MILKVLVIDGSYDARRDIEKKIEWIKNDCELFGEANNGTEALSLMLHTFPDVVFTEIRMAGMDGFEFIENAKKRWPKTKYVITSQYDNFEFLKHAARIGVYDYLQKPIDKDKINDVLIKIAKEKNET